LTKIGKNSILANMASMNISLPDELKAMVELRVRSGLYANASDYVRDLIRDDPMNDPWIVDSEMAVAIDKGEASGDSGRPIETALAEVRASYRAG
jgi:antitoxin ParD1/3/4